MKAKFIFLFSAIFAIHSGNAQTDLIIYGFNGRVQSVTYYIYDNILLKENEELDKDNSNLVSEKILYFDKIGNMDSLVETMYAGHFFEKFITYFVHSGNKLKSSKKYRYYTKDFIEEIKYTWSDQNQLCKFKGVGVNGFLKGERQLSYNFREKKGEYTQEPLYGKSKKTESYKNEFDDRWNLIKTHYSDKEKGNYTILYEYLEYDEKNNPIFMKLIFEDSKKLQYGILKEFIYYDE